MTERFDTGMTHAEATRKAEKWWGEYRGAVKRQFNTTKAAPRVVNGGVRPDLAAPALVFQGAEREEVPSGILSGKAWKKLSARERGNVVAYWHHYHVRVPAQSPALVAPSGKILLN